MNKTTIFACTNEKYYNFIPIFIHSNLFHNKNIDIELGVENNNIPEATSNIIEFCKEKYPTTRILLRVVNFKQIIHNEKKYKLIPHIVRFIETPILKNKYVYISDIDIINLQKNFPELHIEDMKKTKLQYSNIVRKNTGDKRLTGLHFTNWENYYPLPNFEDLMLNNKLMNNDEAFLYQLVKKNTHVSYTNTYRPVHGIHVSPNRDPGGKPGWGIDNWVNEWYNYRNSNEFLYIEDFLPIEIKNIINIIDNEIYKQEKRSI
jgi:hypothetical protein